MRAALVLKFMVEIIKYNTHPVREKLWLGWEVFKKGRGDNFLECIATKNVNLALGIQLNETGFALSGLNYERVDL